MTMLYDYDLTPLMNDTLAKVIADSVIDGYGGDLRELYEDIEEEVESVMADAILKEHGDIDDEELMDLLGEAKEEDFKEVAKSLSVTIRETIVSILQSKVEDIESAISEFEV